jgi:hypothetical protein
MSLLERSYFFFKTMDDFIPVEKHLLSRLLYPNPVCLLGTVSSNGTLNAMTVSWLTCINNSGVLFLSVNLKRHSTLIIQETGKFSLSVAVDGMQPLLLEVGGCSGRDTDKIALIRDLNPCNIDGSTPLSSESSWVYFEVFILFLFPGMLCEFRMSRSFLRDRPRTPPRPSANRSSASKSDPLERTEFDKPYNSSIIISRK